MKKYWPILLILLLTSTSYAYRVGGSDKAAIGLGAVENLSPADMPVSSAAQSALDLKLSKAAHDNYSTAKAVKDAAQDSSIDGKADITSLGNAAYANTTSFPGTADAATTPVDTDKIPLSRGGWLATTWSTIKSTLKTYFDTIYALAAHTHTGAYEPADATIIKESELSSATDSASTTTAANSSAVKSVKDTFDTYTSNAAPNLALAGTALQPTGSGAGLTGITTSQVGAATVAQGGLSVDDYSPIGNGSLHTLASAGYTLSSAQAKWPNVAITDISTQSVDWCAIQQALYAANAAGKLLTLGGKNYVVNQPIDNAFGVNIYGQGMYKTTITGTHDGIVLNNPANMTKLYNFGVQASGTPGANQIGVVFGNYTGLVRGSYAENLYIYNNRTGMQWRSNTGSGVSQCYFRSNTHASLHINNEYNSDQGDNYVANSHFTDDSGTQVAHLYVSQGSGVRITTTKFIRGNTALFVDSANPLAGGTFMSVYTLNNCSLEDGLKEAVKMTRTDGVGPINHVIITGTEMYNNADYPLIDLNGVQRLVIGGGNTLKGTIGRTSPLIKLRNTSHFNLSGNTLYNANNGIDYDSTCTGGAIGPNTYSNVTNPLVGSSSSVEVLFDGAYNLPVKRFNGGSSASASTFWRGDGTWSTPAGSGDVNGPTASTADAVALFNGTGGKTIKDSAKTVTASLGSDDTTLPTSKAVKDVTDTKAPIASPTLTGTVAVTTQYDSNLAVNGAFDSDLTGWSAPAGWAWSSGTALHTAGNSGGLTQSASTFVAGNSYKIVFDIKSGTAGNVQLTAGGVTSNTYGQVADDLTVHFTAISSAALVFVTASTFDGSIDNVRIYEATGGGVATNTGTVVNPAGWLLIGASAPTSSAKLEIVGGAGPQVKINDSGLSPGGAAGGSGVGLYHANTSGAPLAGDRLGYFLFGAYDGIATRNTAFAGAYAEANWSAGSSYPSYLRFETTSTGTARTEKMRIHSSGGVSIGHTTDPGVGVVSANRQLESKVATGTAPLVVASTTNVANLNASSLNGATFANPGAIGGTTPAAITGTTITATGNLTVSGTVNNPASAVDTDATIDTAATPVAIFTSSTTTTLTASNVVAGRCFVAIITSTSGGAISYAGFTPTWMNGAPATMGAGGKVTITCMGTSTDAANCAKLEGY